MADLVELIQEADFALMEIERARVAMEGARITLEMAKNDHDRAKASFDEIVARADELGIPRVKIRKLAEERVAVLLASGLMSIPVNQLKAQRVKKKPAKPKVVKGKEGESQEPVRLDA